MNTETIATWRGEFVTDLSKEELIEALSIMGRMLKEAEERATDWRAMCLGSVE